MSGVNILNAMEYSIPQITGHFINAIAELSMGTLLSFYILRELFLSSVISSQFDRQEVFWKIWLQRYLIYVHSNSGKEENTKKCRPFN